MIYLFVFKMTPLSASIISSFYSVFEHKYLIVIFLLQKTLISVHVINSFCSVFESINLIVKLQ